VRCIYWTAQWRTRSPQMPIYDGDVEGDVPAYDYVAFTHTAFESVDAAGTEEAVAAPAGAAQGADEAEEVYDDSASADTPADTAEVAEEAETPIEDASLTEVSAPAEGVPATDGESVPGTEEPDTAPVEEPAADIAAVKEPGIAASHDAGELGAPKESIAPVDVASATVDTPEE
jgi:hypothetical protein